MVREKPDIPPAIVRDYAEADDVATVLRTPKDTVSHSRGMGDSGYRVEVVEHGCPECGFQRMVRRVDVSPVRANEVRYWCLQPNCAHFVADYLSYVCHRNYPQRIVREPAVME